MFRSIFPGFLIIVSVGMFIFFTNPTYKEVNALSLEVDSFNEALNNSKELQERRNELADKYSSFLPSDITKLEKMLPNNVDNIRLIIEIQNIASQHSLSLKNVEYNTISKEQETTEGTSSKNRANIEKEEDYSPFMLSFSVSGSYNSFLDFLKDLDRNLRIVDITSISFSSGSSNTTDAIYDFNFEIRTYWLKK